MLTYLLCHYESSAEKLRVFPYFFAGCSQSAVAFWDLQQKPRQCTQVASMNQVTKKTDLEHMECLKLNIFTLVTQQVHHHLQVRLIRNIPRHHIEIGPI